MKKILTTALITGLISGAAFAQTTVSSANIVGYVQTATPSSNKLDIVSLGQFSSGSNSVHIQSIFANMSGLQSGTVITNVDRLIIWSGANYTTYGLYQNGTNGPFWMANGAAWTVPTLPKTPANVQIARGQAGWFQRASSAASTNLMVSGDVFLDENFSVSLNGTLMLLSYPYSADINLKDLVVSNATSGTVITNVDRVIVWSGANYVTYGLYQNGTNGPFWMANGAAWTVPTLPKTPANVTVNLGKGFWYQTTNGTKTIGFTCNYTNILQ